MALPSEKESLWRVAIDCSLARIEKGCSNNFGDSKCINCKYYVCNYIDAEPRQLALYMMQAEDRAHDLIEAEKSSKRIVVGVVVGIILILAFCGFFLSEPNIWIRKLREKNVVQPVVQERVQDRQEVIQQPVVIVNAHRDIETTLRLVARDMGNSIDVNRDGLTNCIDAAVLFYQYYPRRNEVTITLNYNEATDMNHLFNVVLVDGIWRAVEPQASYWGYSSYWMRDVWGTKYNSSLNKNATRDYIRFVR